MTADEVLMRVGEVTIYKMYFPHFAVNTPLLSPFRVEYNRSFIVYHSYYSRNPLIKYYWIDFSKKNTMYQKGNVFQFVQELFKLSFTQVLEKIMTDFSTYNPEVVHDVYSPPKPVIEYTRGEDTSYFENNLGLSKPLLSFYDCYGVKAVYRNGNLKYSGKDIYAYDYGKNGFKIYQPFNKENKWYGTASHDAIIGLKQIDKNRLRKEKSITLTKSHKDVMFLSECTTAIAFQSETLIRFDVLDFLKFQDIDLFINYDNDIVGREMSKIIKEYYEGIGGKAYEVFAEAPYKDFSDMAQGITPKAAREYFISEKENAN